MAGDRRKALVTGGAGFIGSHLCERLLDAGHQVLCLDNLWSGDRMNIAHLEGRTGFSFLRADVTHAVPQCEVEEIYHLACPASLKRCREDPIHTILTNVLGTRNVLDLACRTGARVLLASTSEVYGDPTQHPQRESYFGHVNAIGPRACYDEGKRCAETLLTEYRSIKGIDAKIVRIFNTYGPRLRSDDGRVISNFAVAALSGAPIMLHGDGSQTRSFCYVSDLVEGLIRVMATDRSFAGPVNLGGDEEIPIRDLAARIVALANSTSVIETSPVLQDDPRRRRPDLGLARSCIGWKTTVPLGTGLLRTIDYFRSDRGQAGARA